MVQSCDSLPHLLGHPLPPIKWLPPTQQNFWCLTFHIQFCPKYNWDRTSGRVLTCYVLKRWTEKVPIKCSVCSLFYYAVLYPWESKIDTDLRPPPRGISVTYYLTMLGVVQLADIVVLPACGKLIDCCITRIPGTLITKHNVVHIQLYFYVILSDNPGCTYATHISAINRSTVML